jgi:hypothetical protein
MDSTTDQIQRQRFVRGISLAWIPFIFLVPGLANAFRGIWTSKATGFGAVAGGIFEALALFGFATLVVFQVTAVVLLIRSFSKEHPFHGIVSVASLFCCGITLLLVVGSLWLTIHFRQQLS